MEDCQAVAALSAQLAQRIDKRRLALWEATQPQLFAQSHNLTVHAPSPFILEWLRNQFAGEIRDSWQEITGAAGTVAFELGATPAACDLGQPACELAISPKTAAPMPKKPSIELRPTATTESAEPATPRQDFDLASFVVGRSNEYAFSAAEMTARGRQQASPLLVFGPTGVGKTHLLRAILREYRRSHPHSAAVYLTAEDFTTSFVEAVRGSGLPSFRQKCRGAQLLAIDDLQFFDGKKRTVEELLHTLDSMAAQGRQVVLSSDRGLGDLRALGPELVSRLAGGLSCEIEPLDFATRLGIVRQIRDRTGLAIDDEALKSVATQITADARELIGAMNRLDAVSRAYYEPISRELAERALADLARHSTRAVRLDDVQKAVCHVFGIEPAQLRSERKGRALSEPRMLAMWLARKYTRVPWSEIGQFFGRRSHSTVISAHRRVEKMITAGAKVGMADRACNVEDAIRRVEAALRSA